MLPASRRATVAMTRVNGLRGQCLADYFFDAASCSIVRISAAVAGLTPPPPAPPRPPAAPAPRPAVLPAAAGAAAPPRPRPPPSPAPKRSIGFLPLASTSSGLTPF